jgi:DNA-binding FrmR family transcriptional regulator
MLHTTHPEIVNRLKRAQGHLRSIVEMIENGRACLDIAQQLHAVEKAVANAKRTLIHDHIDHCLEQTVGPMSRSARAARGIQGDNEIPMNCRLTHCPDGWAFPQSPLEIALPGPRG